MEDTSTPTATAPATTETAKLDCCKRVLEAALSAAIVDCTELKVMHKVRDLEPYKSIINGFGNDSKVDSVLNEIKHAHLLCLLTKTPPPENTVRDDKYVGYKQDMEHCKAGKFELVKTGQPGKHSDDPNYWKIAGISLAVLIPVAILVWFFFFKGRKNAGYTDLA